MWDSQVGTADFDEFNAVAMDGSGAVYIGGATLGSLAPSFDPGRLDIDGVVMKISADGNAAWTRQIGSRNPDRNDRVTAIDVTATGDVFVAGTTYGDLLSTQHQDIPNAPRAFVARYDSLGSLIWLQQSDFSSISRSIAVDEDGAVFVAGELTGLSPAFLTKYNSSGGLEWSRTFGEAGNRNTIGGLYVETDGTVYAAGVSTDRLGEATEGDQDVFVASIDVTGSISWVQHLGTEYDETLAGISGDGRGSLYIAGTTEGALDSSNFGGTDAFVARLGADGNFTWIRQFGTHANDTAEGIHADPHGSVFVAGSTRGLLGESHHGQLDAFLTKYDMTGLLEWSLQPGTSQDDAAFATSVGPDSRVAIAGSTNGNLVGENQGSADGFVSVYRIDQPVWARDGDVPYNFDNHLNWTPQVAPGVTRDALFESRLSATVTLGSLSLARALIVSDGDVAFVGDPNASLLIGSSMSISEPSAVSIDDAARAVFMDSTALTIANGLLVGVGGKGSLVLGDQSTALADHIQVGGGPAAHGRLVVRDSAVLEISAVSSDVGMQIAADGGLGELVVSGGTVLLPSSAAVSIVGAGMGGVGAITAYSGARLELGALDSALGVGSQATLSVSQLASVTLTSQRDGIDGQSVVEVFGAGEVNVSGDAILGVNSTGHSRLTASGGLDGEPSQYKVGNDLIVGSRGLAVLEIGAGGQVDVSERVLVGAGAGSSHDNQVRVAGHLSFLRSNRIHIGDAGRGTLLVNDGSAVEAVNFVAAHDAGSQGEVVVDGARSRITARDLGISTLGQASLQIINGGLVEASRRFWAGYADAGTASVVVDGVGSLLDIGAGPDPQGGLLIGGEPTAAGGQGTLTVSNGGRLNAREEVLVGPNATADGTLVVTGSGSLADFTNADSTDDVTSVGAAGAGRLDLLDGAVVLSEVGVVGDGSAGVGNVLVSGDGSAWQTNLLTIGVQGTAEVAIDHGGRLATVLDAYVARQDGSNAQLTVGGEGQAQSVFQVGDGLYVGGDQGSSGGTASVDVLPNGRVEVAQNLTVRPQGRVAVQGGALVVDGDVVLKGELALLSGALSIGQIPAAQQVDFQELFSWNAGTLTLTGQGLWIDAEGPLGATVNLVPGKTLVTEGGGLDNEGLLNVVSTSAAFRGGASVNTPTGTINVTEGTLEVAEGLVNEGTLSLFDASVVGSVVNAAGSEATLSGSNSVTGAYAMGPLNSMSVRVRSQSNSSRLDVGDVATLDGTVNVTLIGGYVPILGQRIAFVEAGALIGELATENLPAKRDGVAFYVNYTDTTASLLATYPTDFSADGEVGDADFARWEVGFGPRSATYKDGDANEDGAADGFDLLAWQRQYGLAVQNVNYVAIPEPSSHAWMFACLLLRFASRRLLRPQRV